MPSRAPEGGVRDVMPSAIPKAEQPTHLGYGMGLAMPANSGLVRDAGFGYVKLSLAWRVSEPRPGRYDWADGTPNDSYAGNFVRDAGNAGLKVILRVDAPPAWANGNGGDQMPPTSPEDYGRFMKALATYLQGRVVAYEIWNEPNLASEWGGRSPKPAEYVALLRAAYKGVKEGDPAAKVITAGLATTAGDGGRHSVNDLDFLRGMYAAGAKGYFDVLGSHPYGFASPPEELSGDGVLFFRRAEAQRQVMADNGDERKQVWATELGWLVDPAAYGETCDWPDRNWQKTTPQSQADYLVRAYRFAEKNWPWMGVMVLFNLDFSEPSYYYPCDQMRWHAIANQDGSPRAAYTALVEMLKPTD
jgi:polysaccharide biosynthesis protein PslG